MISDFFNKLLEKKESHLTIFGFLDNFVRFLINKKCKIKTFHHE